MLTIWGLQYHNFYDTIWLVTAIFFPIVVWSMWLFLPLVEFTTALDIFIFIGLYALFLTMRAFVFKGHLISFFIEGELLPPPCAVSTRLPFCVALPSLVLKVAFL